MGEDKCPYWTELNWTVTPAYIAAVSPFHNVNPECGFFGIVEQELATQPGFGQDLWSTEGIIVMEFVTGRFHLPIHIPQCHHAAVWLPRRWSSAGTRYHSLIVCVVWQVPTCYKHAWQRGPRSPMDSSGCDRVMLPALCSTRKSAICQVRVSPSLCLCKVRVSSVSLSLSSFSVQSNCPMSGIVLFFSCIVTPMLSLPHVWYSRLLQLPVITPMLSLLLLYVVALLLISNR